jgi:uncharacterized repeat protein (TIGR03803 family)
MRVLRIACMFGGFLSLVLSIQAQTLTTMHRFQDTDGSEPYNSLIQATDGNLYGTTDANGAYSGGTVFKITPSGTLTTLYNFCSKSSCIDGSNAGALVQGTDGNFYGTAASGGTSGSGTVFKITKSGMLTTLYSFCSQVGCTDGASPYAWLIQGTDGNFYGTAASGGMSSGGTVFKITPGGTLTTLYNFCSKVDCTDGASPYAGLIQATDGNFYGTTFKGGGPGYGTVFKITKSGKLTTLYSFCSQVGCTDGASPTAGLIQATDGNFYGTTMNGANGTSNAGTVFKITSSGKLTTLYDFVNNGEGIFPVAGLVEGTDGSLYGATSVSGAYGGGTVFEITMSGKLTTLYSFCSQVQGGICTDGEYPSAALLLDTNGNFYGTTQNGGSDYNAGTVFSLSVGLGPFVELQSTAGKEGVKIGILGGGFGSSSVVAFGGTEASTIARTGTTFIKATVPAEALTGAVTVTTGATTLTSSQTFSVTPAITSFSPPSGPVGTSVTVKGTGLKQATKVTFDAKPATFTVISDTEVTADVPTGAATGKIAVATKGGSATSATTFTIN